MLKYIRDFLHAFAPEKSRSRYLKYIVHHHKNDSLLHEIKKTGEKIYEEHETPLLVKILQLHKDPVMLDIGANIGLMTLNACAQVSDVRVYAFEPGPRQFAYLKENVVANNLAHQVSAFNVALSSHKGLIDFYIHGHGHSSGDGILDTGRAGKSSVIQVESLTLDEWWINNTSPQVSLIKIDTEGAELQILQKATQLIAQCRPYILIEMCDLNFNKYNLSYQDHLDFFQAHQYEVFDTQRKIQVQQSSDLAPYQYYYVAVPRENDKLF